MISVIDIESTGTDATHDRVVSLGITKVCPVTWSIGGTAEYRFNPQMTMSEEVIAIHGITNKMASTYPLFQEHADHLFKELQGDIAGFNLFGIDLPLLWMEFKRCGYLWEPLKHNIIDAGTLFKKREARGLAAAYKFYCGKEHIDAHSAAIDSAVTAEVLVSQLERYGLKDYPLPLVEAESLFQKPLDVAGKIVLNDKGEPVYAFGKVKGVRVEDDLGFAQWMRSKDFHPDTIRVLDEIRTAL